MKKYYLAFAAAAAIFAGCSNEVNPDEPTPVVVIEKTVSLNARVGDPLTKVSSDNAGIYKWQASDAITILTNNGTNRTFTTTGSGLNASFDGTIPNTDELKDGYALYPASEGESGHKIEGSTITFIMPNQLTWSQDSSNMPMYAKITEDNPEPSAAFKAIGGTMKLICYNIPAGATTLAFTAKSVNISGNFTLDTTAETPALSGSGSGKEIDIDFSGNYSANKVFYIPLPPVTLTGGFTITFKDSDKKTLFEKTTTAAPAIGRNRLVIAPAMNCGAAAADDCVTNDAIKSSVGGSYPGTSSSNTYSITSSKGKTWKVNACKQSDRMQLRNSNGSHIQLPTYSDEIASIILEGVYNAGDAAYSGTLTLSTAFSGGTTITSVAPSVSAGDDVTITIPNDKQCYTGYLLTSAGIRITSITVKFRGKDATLPVISADADELTIPVGSLSATISNVGLSDGIDGLGVSAIIESQTPDGEDAWVDSAEINNGTLTVRAKAANTNAADNIATIKLKASGAVAYPITVTQTSCLVQAPSSYTALAGDETATITWAKDEHASSYLAYLHESETATPASGGTNVTNDLTLNNGIYSLTKGLTNNTTYYLYVKVNTVATNYQASPDYTFVSFTPRKASTEEDPYKASEAYDNISSYASGEGPDGDIYVEGYVYSAEAPASNSQTYTIIWGDATSKALQVFEGKQISNANITDANKVSVGDYVKVKGTAANYEGTTPRLTSGNVILTHYPKLAAPTFSLDPGIPDDDVDNTFYETQTVTLNATNDAEIYYTLDNSAPTTSSTHYTSPFAVSAVKTTTIKAIAVKTNYTTSAVGEKAITIAAPTTLEMSTINATADEDFINFSWTAVENATGYQVSTDGGSSYGETQAATSYKWENLNPSTEYTLYVKAIGTTNKKYTDSAAGSKTQSTNAPTPSWKETALSSISAGDVFVIVGSSGYALPHNGGTSNAPSTVSVTVSGTKLTGSGGEEGVIADKIKWNVSGNASDGYVFYPNGSTTTWLYCTATNNGVRVGTNDNKLFTLTNDGYLLNSATNRYISVYSYQDWRCYGNTDNNPQVVKFYKYTDNRAAAGLSWKKSGVAADSDEATMRTGADTMPTIALDNPNSLTVSYAATNTDVAEINSSGVITLKAGGETTIKAIFPDGDATYKPSTVSYTLTVTDSRTTPVIYLDTTDENRTDSDYNGFTGRTATTTPASSNELPIVLTYTKTDDSGVISDFNTSSGVLTLSGNAGTATVTVSFAGTTEYKPAVSKSYLIKVTSSSGPEQLGNPSNATITAISASGFTATWTAPDTGAPLGYSWKLTTTNDSTASAVSGGSGTSTSDATSVTVSSGITLTSGQDYYFHIKATGDGASYTESAFNSSAEKSFTDWSKTYTSNVLDLVTGTNGSECKVNGYDGIKVGTSSKGGDMSIKVPANTTKLYVHAAAWKGVTGLSLNISGATVSPSSIALTGNDGISNNTPFTFSGDPSTSSYFFVLTLSNITSETTIKFTTSTNKRFVIWGCNAE